MFRRIEKWNAGCQPASIANGQREEKNSDLRTRGYLPHYEGDELIQFITYRLADSLPFSILKKLKFQRDSGRITEQEYYVEIERYLDKCNGPTHLRHERIAKIIEENLLRFDGIKYFLLHWVIMPNHIHLLLRPKEGYSLASIVHSLKSFTANRANKQLGLSGRFWSVEYFDRFIRSEEHFAKTVSYIHNNPVKAGLCESPRAWKFGCAGRHE